MQCNFTLEALHITPHIAAALARDAIETPTEVQAGASAPILSKQHVALRSGTGTGKTLAYVLPLLQRARLEKDFRAVILAPGPELAVQILRTVEAYKNPSIKSVGLVGGGNPGRQQDKLKKHPQIMVGTPGRVLDLIFARKIKTAQIATLVLDEVDEILSPENDAALREVCSRPEFKAQVLCVSATLGERAEAFMDTFMQPAPIRVEGGLEPLSDTIAHHIVPFGEQSKEVALLELLGRSRIKRAMVFVNKLYNAAHLFRLLSDQGIPCATLSAQRDKRERELAVQQLRGNAPCVLIVTDAAARGLDVKNLDWVIHYEVARNATTYLHRAGRTGRAGRAGRSVVLAASAERFLVERHGKNLGIAFSRVPH